MAIVALSSIGHICGHSGHIVANKSPVEKFPPPGALVAIVSPSKFNNVNPTSSEKEPLLTQITRAESSEHIENVAVELNPAVKLAPASPIDTHCPARVFCSIPTIQPFQPSP